MNPSEAILWKWQLIDHTGAIGTQQIDQRWMTQAERDERQKAENVWERLWEKPYPSMQYWKVEQLIKSLCSYQRATGLERFIKAVDPEGQHSSSYWEGQYLVYCEMVDRLMGLPPEVIEAVALDYCRLCEEEADQLQPQEGWNPRNGGGGTGWVTMRPSSPKGVGEAEA